MTKVEISETVNEGVNYHVHDAQAHMRIAIVTIRHSPVHRLHNSRLESHGAVHIVEGGLVQLNCDFSGPCYEGHPGPHVGNAQPAGRRYAADGELAPSSIVLINLTELD